MANSKIADVTIIGKIMKWFPAAFIGSVLTILIQQAFFRSNKKTEARIELQKDFLKENHLLYNKLIFWTDINIQLKPEIAHKDSLVGWKIYGMVVHLDTTKPNAPMLLVTLKLVMVLRLLVDTTLQNLSQQYTHEIDSEKFKLEPSIMQRFIEINNDLNSMQSQKDSTVQHLIEVGWANGKSLQEWVKMNRELKSKIDSFTNLE